MGIRGRKALFLCGCIYVIAVYTGNAPVFIIYDRFFI